MLGVGNCDHSGSLNNPSRIRSFISKRQHSLGRNYTIHSSKDLPPVIHHDDLEVMGVIGEGAFGRVLKVRHKGTKTILVMKEMLDASKENEDALLKEVSSLRLLNHENVLSCLGITMRQCRLCLLVEYIDAGSLHAILLDKPRKPLSWHLRASYAKDIAAGMRYLHSQGVVHRDLTTNNCLVRTNQSVVVADLGLCLRIPMNLDTLISAFEVPTEMTKKLCRSQTLIPAARTTHREVDSHLTKNLSSSAENVSLMIPISTQHSAKRKYTVAGSPYWMAPEMIAGKPYDSSVDIYSFGVILCQLIARIDADPDFLPRCHSNLSVDINLFQSTLAPADTPVVLMNLAVACTQFESDERPTFLDCFEWLQNRCMYKLRSSNGDLQAIPLSPRVSKPM